MFLVEPPLYFLAACSKSHSKNGGIEMAKKPLSVDDIFDQLHGSSNSSLAFTGLIDRVADDDQSIRFARAEP
jgi:hypothetical protein